ncbi:MAG: cytochrome P450 [Segniliparus sp.]|uniref:cytochrome P450 n=1 Tax=Segniliparus sp. TaxID=2804064 RepID=UPI003F2DBFCB
MAHSAEAPEPSLSRGVFPPRWAPSLLRWHKTPVGVLRSWVELARMMWSIPRYQYSEALARLPGMHDVVEARIPIVKFYLVRSAELAHQILVSHQDKYAKSAEYDLLGVAFGSGLVTNLDDKAWQRGRRIVQPIFAKRNVDSFDKPMVHATRRAVERWERAYRERGRLDIAAEMNALTLDIIGTTMFGDDLTGPMAETMRKNFAMLLHMFGVGSITGISRPTRWFSNWAWRRSKGKLSGEHTAWSINILRTLSSVLVGRGLREIERYLDGLIARARANPPKDDSLLALLLKARDPETGEGLSDLQLRYELMTFLGAGHETTASALAWVWKLLAEHPEVRHKLHDEVDTVLGGRAATAADLDDLPWTRAVLVESMRLYPPIVALARVAKEEDVIDGVRIPEGATVVIALYSAHHDAGRWDSPEVFNPRRFLTEDGKLVAQPKQGTLPFGAGKRMCVASGFANLEAALIVATVAQRLELDLVQQPEIKRDNTFTGGPKDPIWVRPRERAPLVPAERV